MRNTNTIYLRILISIIDQRKNIFSIIAFITLLLQDLLLNIVFDMFYGTIYKKILSSHYSNI